LEIYQNGYKMQFFASSNVFFNDFPELMLQKCNFTVPIYASYVKEGTFPK